VTVYRLSQLTKVLGERKVLDIPNLEIEDNRICAVLGSNGAGKTTLLSILGFLEAPSAGRVFYRNRQVRYSEPELQRLRKDVVVVDQHPILFTTTVYKNLEFGLRIRKIPKEKRERIITQSLDLVGMRSFARAAAHHLSGGETQRVALARALALSPGVLLCDEPTSSVDAENQNIILNVLRQINDVKHISVLFTTHDRSQAARLSHHTLVLNRGKLAPALYENVFRGILGRDAGGQQLCVIHDKLRLPLGGHQVPAKKDSVRVFIDPEKIDLTGDGPIDAVRPGTHGRIVQIMQESGRVRLLVDVGVWIAVSMTPKRYAEIRPLVGDPAGLIIPPEAVQLF